MLKFFLVAHLTYENHWGKWHSKIRTFGFFGTPYWTINFRKIEFVWMFYNLRLITRADVLFENQKALLVL